MHQPSIMCCLESIRDLCTNKQNIGNTYSFFSSNNRGKGITFNIFHNKKWFIFDSPVKYLNNIWMIQISYCLSFSFKSFNKRLLLNIVWFKGFNSNHSFQLFIFSFIHKGHSTFTKEFKNLVSIFYYLSNIHFENILIITADTLSFGFCIKASPTNVSALMPSCSFFFKYSSLNSL